MTTALCSIAFLCFGIVLPDDKADAKAKVDKAEAAHKAAEEAFRKAVEEHLAEMEGKSQKRGDRKAIDQVKGQREAFKKNEVPLSFPYALKKKYADQRALLESAYESALKTLTKAGDGEGLRISNGGASNFASRRTGASPQPRDGRSPRGR
jgi:hypothetical protein